MISVAINKDHKKFTLSFLPSLHNLSRSHKVPLVTCNLRALRIELVAAHEAAYNRTAEEGPPADVWSHQWIGLLLPRSEFFLTDFKQ